MHYHQAKIEMLKAPPRIPFKLIFIEAAAMIGVAGLLVQLFG